MKKRTTQILILINALVFPVFLLFFYGQLPESVPMQFSLSGKVNWSLPLNAALTAFIGFFVIYVGQVFFRFRKDERYPQKDTLVALFLPELFVIILIIAMIVK